MEGGAHSQRPSGPDLTYDIAREREFYSLGLGDQFDGEIHSGPRDVRPSPDRALTAFAQLATLRLNVRRSFISFFDRQHQYFVAEATQSLSLQNDSVSVPGDELIYGATVIPKRDSICQHTVALPVQLDENAKDVSILVVPDLRKDERFADRKYTLDKGSVFYAGVAIVSPNGHRIGAYCVIDDKPRKGLDAEEVAFMKDMATTVMVHMDMLRAKLESVKGERMVRGLGSFVEGKSSMDDWWMEPSDGLARQSARTSAALSPGFGHQWADKQYSMHHKTVSQDSETPTASAQPKSKGLSAKWDTKRRRASRASSDDNVKPLRENPKAKQTSKQDTLSLEVKATFGRATAIIRESLQVSGVCCFDARAGHTFGGLIDQEDTRRPRRRKDSGDVAQNLDVVASEKEAMIEDEKDSGQKNAGLDRLKNDFACEVLGFSTTNLSSISGDQSSEVTDGMTEAFLRYLLRRYPHGTILNFDESGNTSNLDGDRSPVEKELDSNDTGKKQTSLRPGEDVYVREMFPDVRSLALVPLWDSGQRFFSGCIAWTTDPHRILTSHSELSYLAAFGDSIMAEVSRIDAKLADKSKSDFISSISHELRSPLHGILGSVECLEDTTLDAFQENLVHTVETCGKTLLDTIDHLLDFAKINNFTRKGRGGPRATGDQAPSSALDVDVDLSVITEEVLETVFAGHNMMNNGITSGSADGSNSSEATALSENARKNPEESSAAKQKGVSVVVDIDKADSHHWIFRTQAGAWRRILMNLFGNSLKYTENGFIKVLLKAQPLPKENKGSSSKITLVVTDSGKGISQEYLKNSLFVPFAQEDALQPGTGLGLAITATIIRSMGGEIDVKSEQGRGTETTVTLTLEHAPLSQESLEQSLISSAARKTKDLKIGFVGFQADSFREQPSPQMRSPENSRYYFMRSFHRLCHNWFGMEMKIMEGLNHDNEDIFLTTESGLEHLQHELGRKMEEKSDKDAQMYVAGTPLLVLCDTIAAANAMIHHRRAGNHADIVEYISQPCGPRKLAKALALCLDRLEASKNPEKHNPTVHEALDEGKNDGREDTDASKGQIGNIDNKTSGDGTNEGRKDPKRLDVDPSKITKHRAIPQRLKSSDKYTKLQRLEYSQASPTSPRAPKEKSTATPRKIRNVLLVDDNKINLQLLVTFMKKSGHSFSTASNGLEAFEIYKSECSTIRTPESMEGEKKGRSSGVNEVTKSDKGEDQQPPERRQQRRQGQTLEFVHSAFDVVLMDISMPVMDGLESTRHIRAHERAHKIRPTTVIALTGLASASAQQEAFSSGIDTFMTKPVKLKELSQLLDEIGGVDHSDGGAGRGSGGGK
ncbi:hypothetical protein MBLNU459_g7248t3 [Dothideomycetes sp. NU459]